MVIPLGGWWHHWGPFGGSWGVRWRPLGLLGGPLGALGDPWGSIRIPADPLGALGGLGVSLRSPGNDGERAKAPFLAATLGTSLRSFEASLVRLRTSQGVSGYLGGVLMTSRINGRNKWQRRTRTIYHALGRWPCEFTKSERALGILGESRAPARQVPGRSFEVFESSGVQGGALGVPKTQRLGSYFLTDIDPVCKICKNLLNGSSGCVGPRLFHEFEFSRFLNVEISKNNMLKINRDFFFLYLESFDVSKVKNNWFEESWTRPPSPKNNENGGFAGFPKVKTKNTSPK